MPLSKTLPDPNTEISVFTMKSVLYLALLSGASALVVSPMASRPAVRARCPAPQAVVELHDLPAAFALLAEIVDENGERAYG